MHIDILSKLSMMLMDEEFTASLKQAKTVEEFLQIIDAAETEKDMADAEKEEKAKVTDLVADRAKAEQKLGCLVKVETRGSGGAKNVLTEEEIEAADGIIVAADTNVPMDRFDGKRVIECQVSSGINKAEGLIQNILDGEAPVYKSANGKKKSSVSNAGDSIGHTLYKHLMNGVSHMFPFVVFI